MSGRDDVRRTTPGVKLTYDDFLLFHDDGKRHELLDGEHYVTPSPSRKHLGHRLELDRPDWNVAGVERSDTLTTPLLPGLHAPLARIFKD